MDATSAPILEIGLILLAAVAAGWVARRLGLPAIVGYLAVGLGFSPFTPGYVADHEQLELLADVGVVLLLFEVGIEVDLARLRRDHGPLLWAAPLQVVVSTALSAAVLMIAGLDVPAAALVGLCVALSSSVVIVNITVSRRRTTDKPTEVALLGWAVMQDLVGVALGAVLLALFAPTDRSLPVTLLGLGLFGVMTLLVARILPAILRALHDEHDLFLITSVASGLTLAVTESREAAEARRRLLPFRDVFAVLFFIAIGTLVDPGRLLEGLPWLALLLALVVGAKVAIAYALAKVTRLQVRPIQLAAGLGQMGEFSFVLASAAVALGLVSTDLFAAVLGTVVVSIVASTVLVRSVGAASPGDRPVADAGAQ
jgi:CPA2 family monovalent cation:H+ antiporter-2